MYKKEHVASSYERQINGLIWLVLRQKFQVVQYLKTIRAAILLQQNFGTTDKEVDEVKNGVCDRVRNIGRQIDDHVLAILALRQPMASDLRFFICSLKISYQLTTVADWGRRTAKSLLRIENKIPGDLRKALANMIDTSIEILDLTVTTFLKSDIFEHRKDRIRRDIRQIRGKEQIIEDIYQSFKQAILIQREHDAMSGMSHDGMQAYEVFSIGKNLEKVADSMLEIADIVEYALIGPKIDKKT